MFNKLFYIRQYLCPDHLIFDSAVAKLAVIKQINLNIIIGYGILCPLLTEIVYNQIMRNAGDPCLELSVIGISSLFDRYDNLYKGFLKDILCKFTITYDKINIRMNTAFVAVQ